MDTKKRARPTAFAASSGQRLTPALRLAAVAVDLISTAALLWLSSITAVSVLLGIDNTIRLHIIGQTQPITLIPGHKPVADYATLRAEIEAHRLLVGRPALDNLLTMIIVAAALLLFMGFIRSVGGTTSLGGFLLGACQRWRDRSLSRALETSAELATEQVRDRTTDLILERLRLKNWLEMLTSVREMIEPLKALPGDGRRIALATIAIVIAISIVTPIVLNSHGLAQLSFTAPDGSITGITRLSLYISIAALSVAWAAAIAGASDTSPWLLLVIAMFYVFTIPFVGLAGGRAWWVVAPQWAIVLVAATCPLRRRMKRATVAVLWALSTLAVFHTFRLTPLAMFKAGLWPSIKSLPVAALIALAITPLLIRAKIELTVRRAFIAVAALTSAFLAVSLRAGEQRVADSIYYSTSMLMSFLVVFWFLLGRNLVLPCIAFAKAAVEHAGRVFGIRAMPRLLVAACVIELAVIAIVQYLYPDIDRHSSKLAVAIPAHQSIVLLLLTAAAVMSALNALTPRRATWWFAIWAFSLAMLIAYFGAQLAILNPAEAANFSGQLKEQIGGAAELGGIILLTLGMLLEALGGHRQIATGTESETSPGGLLTYSGTLALLAALTHLVMASKTYPPDAAAAYTYAGMALMWPAIAVLAGLSAIKRITGHSQAGVAAALLVGATASVVTDLLRRSFGDPASIGLTRQLLAMISGELAVVGCVVLIVRGDHKIAALDSIAIGMACAFGFVIAYVGELVVPILTLIVGIPSHMIGFTPGINVTEKWLHYLPFGAHGNPIPHADLMIFYVLVPAIAGLAGYVVWSRTRGDTSLRMPAVLAASLILSVLYAIPLYRNPVLVVAFGNEARVTAFQAVMIEDAYIRAAAYLALPAIVIVAFIYSNLRKSKSISVAALVSQPVPTS